MKREEGFTLTELMVVVIILGVLAAIAVPSFVNYIYKSRTAEATTFLGEVRQRQESYRAEFGVYASPSASIMNYNPAALAGGGRDAQGWPTGTAWDQLGARPDGPVRFQYSSVGGVPGAAVPVADLAASGLGMTDFWFVAQARGDLDGDSDQVTFEANSASSTIWCSELGKGWE